MEKNSWSIALISLIVGVVIGVWVSTAYKANKSQYQKPMQQPTSMQTKETKLDVKLVNHIQAKLPEQDVFIEGSASGTVVRVEGDAATKEETLKKDAYASAKPVAHDPFKLGKNPLGPFEEGKELGFTLKQWLSATGNGTYTVKGDKAMLSLSFQNLVRNGTYTVWCSRLTFPPNPKIVDRPCGVEDGSQNVFKADASGNGSFNLELKTLEQSSKETASVIAVAYHSDGKTYGANPGDFGLVTHVQLFYLVPVPESK